MNQFKEMSTELKNLQSVHSSEVQTIEERALELMAKKLDKNKKLKSAIKKLESSKDLCSTEDEYFSCWIRFNASDYIDTDSELEKRTFDRYLAENYFANIDCNNDALMMSIGPCILINDEGDVLDQDSGKWVIQNTDYETESERNKLIEKYMEKHGYFPSVISCDRYDNAYYMNTKKRGKK